MYRKMLFLMGATIFFLTILAGCSGDGGPDKDDDFGRDARLFGVWELVVYGDAMERQVANVWADEKVDEDDENVRHLMIIDSSIVLLGSGFAQIKLEKVGDIWIRGRTGYALHGPFSSDISELNKYEWRTKNQEIYAVYVGYWEMSLGEYRFSRDTLILGCGEDNCIKTKFLKVALNIEDYMRNFGTVYGQDAIYGGWWLGRDYVGDKEYKEIYFANGKYHCFGEGEMVKDSTRLFGYRENTTVGYYFGDYGCESDRERDGSCLHKYRKWYTSGTRLFLLGANENREIEKSVELDYRTIMTDEGKKLIIRTVAPDGTLGTEDVWGDLGRYLP
ncbi:MAG: hypothetical protein FWB85_01520 [Chitinispirillia bacterium]|nr:hypothetical protein [Chitinispirillia bacterium]MCL2241098.1 hypothetical protein [Chitinispirillia bacterium]